MTDISTYKVFVLFILGWLLGVLSMLLALGLGKAAGEADDLMERARTNERKRVKEIAERLEKGIL